MTSIWRKSFGFTDEEHEGETYEEAVQRAKKLLREENYEDACRILKYADEASVAELREVDIEKVKEWLSENQVFPSDFKDYCARFRRYISIPLSSRMRARCRR